MRDLAPEIYRQRLVVERLVDAPICAADSDASRKGLGPITGMVVLTEPVSPTCTASTCCGSRACASRSSKAAP